MRKLLWSALVALPLAVAGGLVYANSQGQAGDEPQRESVGGYICPVTGEELPCPDCCPFNEGQ
jgi:hypothetical protein